jgi:hypothetical protein
MNCRTRIRFIVEGVLAPPMLAIMVLLGFRPLGGRGSRRA